MYYYILDSQNIPTPEYERLQIELQGLIAEFNIAGEIGRITTLRTMKDLVETAKQRGAKTIIACGNDDTFDLMLALIQGTDFTFGFVPFDKNSYLAKMLGIDSLRTAIKTIAARRIEKIDIGLVNGHHFISYLQFGTTGEEINALRWWNSLQFMSRLKPHNIQVRIDDSYSIASPSLMGIITNTRSTFTENQQIANPTDGQLDFLSIESLKTTDIFRYKQTLIDAHLEDVPHATVIKCKKIELLEPRGLPITLAGRIITKFPATVEILPSRLKIIVGKNRSF